MLRALWLGLLTYPADFSEVRYTQHAGWLNHFNNKLSRALDDASAHAVGSAIENRFAPAPEAIAVGVCADADAGIRFGNAHSFDALTGETTTGAPLDMQQLTALVAATASALGQLQPALRLKLLRENKLAPLDDGGAAAAADGAAVDRDRLPSSYLKEAMADLTPNQLAAEKKGIFHLLWPTKVAKRDLGRYAAVITTYKGSKVSRRVQAEFVRETVCASLEHRYVDPHASTHWQFEQIANATRDVGVQCGLRRGGKVATPLSTFF